MARFLWMLAAMLAVAATSTIPTLETRNNYCPKKCKCNPYYTEATCTTLDLPKFKAGNMVVLKIDQPTDPIRLDEETFSKLGLNKLHTISIQNATVEKLDKNVFKNLPNLAKLSIVNSKLPVFHENTLIDLHRLKTLDLHGTTLERFEYVRSDTLQELTLSNTNLRQFTNKNFDNFPKLIFLDLSNNHIKSLDSFVFSNLKQLAEVHLTDNDIRALPEDLFKLNEELNNLQLSGNPLRTFNLNITSELEKLDLRSCKLIEVGESLRRLYMLTNLDLSDNEIEHLNNSTFDQMADLRFINLSSNALKTLPKDVFRFNSELRKIILDHNDLKVIPEFFSLDGSFKTYYFSCQNCQLDMLPDETFANFPAIVKLLLGYNRIKAINTKIFHRLPNLIDVDLSHNQITSIDKEAFAKNSALVHVNLSFNSMTAISPEVFAMNKVLKNLVLSSCSLTQLWGEPRNVTIPSLMILYAPDNKITQLTVEDLEVTPHIGFFDLKNNPLECTLELRNAIMWLTQTNVQHPRSEDDDKTHLPLKADASGVFELAEDHLSDWEMLANQSCLDYYDDYDYLPDDDFSDSSDEDEDSFFEDTNVDAKLQKIQSKTTENARVIDDEVVGFDDDNNIDIRIAESGYVEHRYVQYSYLWPAFIFIFTALAVLVVAANIILLVLKKRGTLDLPRGNLPQIKIIPWNISSKMKKHSGSVYQPLSEDMSGPKTPMINRYEQIPKIPTVHDSTP